MGRLSHYDLFTVRRKSAKIVLLQLPILIISALLILGTGVISNHTVSRFGKAAIVQDLSPVGELLKAQFCLFMVAYQSSGYLAEVIDPFISIINELVVADGPRSVNLPLLESVDLLYHEDSSPIKIFIEGYVKERYPHIDVSYTFNIWQSESEQRRFGFETCNSPYMLQTDTDMLIRLNFENILWFMQTSRYHVAQIDIVSVYNPSKPLFSGESGEFGTVRCPIMVKRHKMKADDYFNYLWIIGESQHKPDGSIVSPVSVGYCYHLTLHISINAMFSKYSFYVGSWYYLHDGQKYDELVATMKTLKNEIPSESLKLAFLRMKPESALGIPIEDGKRYFFLSSIDSVLKDLLHRVSSQDIQFSGRHISPLHKIFCVVGWPIWTDITNLVTAGSASQRRQKIGLQIMTSNGVACPQIILFSVIANEKLQTRALNVSSAGKHAQLLDLGVLATMVPGPLSIDEMPFKLFALHLECYPADMKNASYFDLSISRVAIE